MPGPLPTRLIVRSLTGLALGVAQLLLPQHDGDVTELFIFIAIRSASRAAGDPEAWAPSAPARSVSVSALAHSLGVPVETTRRRVGKLIDKGFAIRTGSGVCVSPAYEASAQAEATLNALVSELDATLLSLAHAGLDLAALAGVKPADEAVGYGAEPAPPPPALTGGIAMAFCLRGLEQWAGVFGDLTRGLVWCAFVHENTKALHASNELSWAYGHHDTPPPDSLRTPVSIREVAALYFVPYETARRHVNALMEADAMERVDGRGLIVPARALTPDRLGAAHPVILSAFLQMLAALSRAGFAIPKVPA